MFGIGKRHDYYIDTTRHYRIQYDTLQYDNCIETIRYDGSTDAQKQGDEWTTAYYNCQLLIQAVGPIRMSHDNGTVPIKRHQLTIH